MRNNVLRRILRNVVGVYRSNYRVPLITKNDLFSNGKDIKNINNLRKHVFRLNRMEQLLPRLLEEFLISGLSVVKIISSAKAKNVEPNPGIRIFPVTPDNFFLHSDGYDPRGWDVDLIGEMHYVSYSNLISRFCHTADDYDHIRQLYADRRECNGVCKLLEIWHKDSEICALMHDEKKGTLRKIPIEKIGKQKPERLQKIRTEINEGWRCSWYAQDGSLLRKDPLCSSHPYVWKAYPFLDGEVHSYISDIIDQQKYVNHLITLYDFIMKSSAKGVLLFPDESLPKGMTLQDVANEWSMFNGVIPYRAQPGVPLPTQVSSNAANIGITELLKIEMQMLEDISGVSPTLQGKLETNISSGTLFAQQNQAAMTSLLDLIQSFEEFAADIAAKIHP